MGSKKYRKRHIKGVESNDRNDAATKVTDYVADADKEEEKRNRAKCNSTHTGQPIPIAGNEDNSAKGSKKSRKKGNVAESEDLKGLVGFRYETCLGAQSDAAEGKRMVLSNYLVQRCSMGGYRQSNYPDGGSGANGPTYTTVKLRKQFYPEAFRESFMLQNFQFVLPPSGHFAPSSKVGVLGSAEAMGEERPHRSCSPGDKIACLDDRTNTMSADLLTLDFNDFLDGSLEKRPMEQRRKMTAKLDSCVDSYDHLFDWDSVLFVVYKGTSLEGGPRDFRCPICLEMPIAPRLTKCGHLFCFSCILRSMNAQKYLGIDYTGRGQQFNNPNLAPFTGSDVPQQNMTPLQQQEVQRQQEGGRANFLKEAAKKRTCPICSCDVLINELRPCILQLVDNVLSDQIAENIPANIVPPSHRTHRKVISPKGHIDHMYDAGDEGTVILSSPESSVTPSSVPKECLFTLVCRRLGSSVVTEGDAFHRHKYFTGCDDDGQEDDLADSSNVRCGVNGGDDMEVSNCVLIPQYGSGDAIFSRYSFATYQLIESQLKSDMLGLRMKLEDMNNTLPRPFSDDDGYEYNATEGALKFLLRNGYNYNQYALIERCSTIFPALSPTLSATERHKRGCENSSPELRSTPVFSTPTNRSFRSQPRMNNGNNSDLCGSKKGTPILSSVNMGRSISPMSNVMLPPPTMSISSLNAAKTINNTTTGGNTGERKGNTGTELLWFYQETSGQHVYLHPLNVSMLRRQFSARGSNHSDNISMLSTMPAQLKARLLEVTSVTQTEEIRRKARQAPHVPLGSTFKVAFVDLPATGLLSEDVLLHFKDALREKYQSLAKMMRSKNNERECGGKRANIRNMERCEAAAQHNAEHLPTVTSPAAVDMESIATLNLTETEIMWLNGDNILASSGTAASASSAPHSGTPKFEARQDPLSHSTALYLQDNRQKGSRPDSVHGSTFPNHANRDASLTGDPSLYPTLVEFAESSLGASTGAWESPPNTTNARKKTHQVHVLPVVKNSPRDEVILTSCINIEEDEVVDTGRRKRKKKNKWTLVEGKKKNKLSQYTPIGDIHGDDSSVVSGKGTVAPLATVNIFDADSQTPEAGALSIETPLFSPYTPLYSSDDPIQQNRISKLYDEMEQLAENSSSHGTSIIVPHPHSHHHVKGGGEGPSQRQAKRLEAIIAADRNQISTCTQYRTSSAVSTPMSSPPLAPKPNDYSSVPSTCHPPPDCNPASLSPCQPLTFVKNKKKDHTANKVSSNAQRSNPFEVLAANNKKTGMGHHRDSNACLTNFLLPEAKVPMESLPVNEDRNATTQPTSPSTKQEWAMKAATDGYRKLHQKATPHAQPNWTGTPMKSNTAAQN